MSDDRDAPVFLGGIAGTGKTRLGSLLGRHSRLAVTRKTYLWRDVYGRHGDLTDPVALDRCVAAALAVPGVRALHVDPDEVAARMAEGPRTYAHLFDVIHRLHAEAVGKVRWCDQLGLAEAYADPIFKAFPSARFVHMVGDPRATLPTKRTPGISGWAVGKWLTSMELAARNTARYGDRYLVVRHEDLQSDEERTLREVTDFLGEELEPTMLITTPPAPPPLADPARQRFVEAAASAAMEESGYAAVATARRSPPPSALLEWPADRLGLTAWRRIGARAIAKQIAAQA